MQVQVTIDQAALSDLQRKILETARNTRPLMAAAGSRAESELQKHFQQRESEPNKRGWPSQHFWARILRATALTRVTDTEAEITIADPAIRQKVYGGPINPTEGHTYLAIPAIAAAYGSSPLIFRDRLHPVFRTIGGERRIIGLAENVASEISYGRPRKDGTRAVKQTASRSGTMWYWLVKSVTQAPDPRALPDETAFNDAIVDEVKATLDRLELA